MTAPSVSLGFSVIQATRCLLKPWCSASSNTGRRSGKPAWTASRIIESSAKARVIRAVNVLQPIRVSVQVGVARNPSGLTVWKEPLLNSGHIVVAGGGGRIEGQPLSPLKAFAHTLAAGQGRLCMPHRHHRVSLPPRGLSPCGRFLWRRGRVSCGQHNNRRPT